MTGIAQRLFDTYTQGLNLSMQDVKVESAGRKGEGKEA